MNIDDNNIVKLTNDDNVDSKGTFYYINYRFTELHCNSTYVSFALSCTALSLEDKWKGGVWGFRKIMGLVEISEREYQRLKRDACVEFQNTGHPNNDGFVSNFSKSYTYILNERDRILE